MRKLVWILAFVAVPALLMLAAFAPADGFSGYRVLDQTVAGRELRLVVETYRMYEPFLSHSSKTADAKGYLVTVDLSSEKPLADRTRTYGPLWDVADPRSSTSFMAGANFTEEDVAASNATPVCIFDVDGTLLRYSNDGARKARVRDAFVAAPEAGSWKRVGDVKRVDDRTPAMSEDRLESPSGRWVLLYQGGQAKLFDQFSGETKRDDWLTATFAHARTIKNFENVRMFLTEELDHLVVSPMAVWNRNGEILETFDLDGNTHNRADVGFAYSRPDKKPALFPRKLGDEGSHRQAPHGAFSIGGELFLFAYDEKSLRLYRPNGGGEMRASRDAERGGGSAWPLGTVEKMQHDPKAREVLLFVTGEIRADTILERPVSLVRWNYRTGSITRDDAQVKDLFEDRRGELHPKTVVAVR